MEKKTDELSDIPKNCAKISVDSSNNVLNILSKFSYDADSFKSIVGAVTIIFTEDDLVNGDKNNCKTYFPWKKVPSSLSILPNPGYEHSAKFNSMSKLDNQCTDKRLNSEIKKELVDNHCINNMPAAKTTYAERHDREDCDTIMLEEVNGTTVEKLSNACSVCQKEINSHREFMFHATAHKSEIGGGETCPICLKVFTTNVSLIRHSYSHSKKSYYPCPICKIYTFHLDSLKKHFHRKHSTSLCKFRHYLNSLEYGSAGNTSEGFAKENANDDSMKGNGSQECFPQKNHSSSSEESDNAVSANGSELEIVDDNLQVSFADVGRISTIRNDIQSSPKKSSTCSFCWSPVNNLEEYLHHMDAHRYLMNVANTCPVCLHEFSDKMRVKRHASKHVQTAVYSCPECPIQIPRVDSFRRHIRKVHPEHLDIIELEEHYKRIPCDKDQHSVDVFDTTLHSFIKTEIPSPNEDQPSSSGECSFSFVDSAQNIDRTITQEVNQPVFPSTIQLITEKHEDEVSNSKIDFEQSYQIGATDLVSSNNFPFTAPRGRGGSKIVKSSLINRSGNSHSSIYQTTNPYGRKSRHRRLSSVCHFCSAELATLHEFLEHARIHAQGDKITCPVCVTDYARKLGLVRHSVNHIPSEVHQCTICRTSFGRRDVMLRHFRKVHKVPMTALSPNVKILNTRLTSYSSEDLPMLNFTNIVTPKISVHTDDNYMDVHSDNLEGEREPFSCGMCSAQFEDPKKLTEHLQQHPQVL